MVTVSLDLTSAGVIIVGSILVSIGSGIGTAIGKELYEEHFKTSARRLLDGIAKNGKHKA